jgi:hypothetical protein
VILPPLAVSDFNRKFAATFGSDLSNPSLEKASIQKAQPMERSDFIRVGASDAFHPLVRVKI